jgi:hypothetical protein
MAAPLAPRRPFLRTVQEGRTSDPPKIGGGPLCGYWLHRERNLVAEIDETSTVVLKQALMVEPIEMVGEAMSRGV